MTPDELRGWVGVAGIALAVAFAIAYLLKGRP